MSSHVERHLSGGLTTAALECATLEGQGAAAAAARAADARPFTGGVGWARGLRVSSRLLGTGALATLEGMRLRTPRALAMLWTPRLRNPTLSAIGESGRKIPTTELPCYYHT